MASEARRRGEPGISGTRLGSGVFKQLRHVGVVELRRMWLPKAVIDEGQTKADAIAFCKCVHPKKVPHPLVDGERRDRATGNGERASLDLTPVRCQTAVAYDVSDTCSRRFGRERPADLQGDRIEKCLHGGSTVNVELLMRGAVDCYVKHDRRKERWD